MATLDSVRDRAKAAIAEHNYPRALLLTDLIRRYFPRDLKTGGLQGEIQLACGRWAEARESFATVLQLDPESLEARAGLALLAEVEGDLERALEQLERAFDLDCSNARVAAEIERLSSRLCHSWLTDPGSPQHALARRSLREKRYPRAALLFSDAARRLPERVEIVVGLARSLWLAGEREEAARVATGVLGGYPDCLKMLAILAGVSFARGEGEALFLLRKIDELDPGNFVARRLFLDAGLPFPRVGGDPEIPEAELRGIIGFRRRIQTDPGEYEDEPVDEEWDGEEDLEPFVLPEDQLEGEWVRAKRNGS